LGVLLWVAASAAVGQTITVGTASSTTASFAGASQSAGPFPWSDLGIAANVSVAQGDLSVATGGSTAFNLTNPLTAGEQVTSHTTLNVNYTPGWSGSVSQASATGNANSSFVYSLGPLNGSTNILNASVSSPSSPSMDLSASLIASNGSSVGTSSSASGPGATAGYSLEARGCAFVCVTLASASLGVTVGTQVQQSVSVTPTVTYGDLVWISTSPISHYSASDPQTFIAGTGGTIANQLGALGQYALNQGQSFYYNILPEVKLNMAVTSQAQLNLPASITASYNVFGVGGSQSFPLGNLYTLSTGQQGYDVSTTFHDADYYSVKIDLSHSSDIGTVGGTYTAQLTPHGDDPLPADTGPCAGMPVGCALHIPGGPGSLTGYGVPSLGPLIPGDQGSNPVCAPAGTPNAGICINQVTTSGGPLAAPEIDATTGASALTLLAGMLAVMGGRLQSHRKRLSSAGSITVTERVIPRRALGFLASPGRSDVRRPPQWQRSTVPIGVRNQSPRKTCAEAVVNATTSRR
jgi:hypothetical protein